MSSNSYKIFFLIGALVLIFSVFLALRSYSSLARHSVPVVVSIDAQIVQINSLRDATDRRIKTAELREQRKSSNTSESIEQPSQVIYVDKNNHITKYIKEIGSDDSVLTFNFYYDQDNKLRFVMIVGGAVNGSELEHTIYFDDQGKRIFEQQRYLSGPGYTFPTVWPAKQLIFDAAKDFSF